MYNYNSLLIDKYSLVNNIKVVTDIKIDEINKSYIEPFMMELEKHFECSRNENIKFEVYPYDDIMLFIQSACKKCIYELNAIRGKHTIGNPEELYVEI
jgi:hypothetical protein